MSFEKLEKPISADSNKNEKELFYEPGVGIRFSKIKKSEPKDRPQYDELRDYLVRHQKELNQPIIEEAKRKRNQLLESRGFFSLSKEDFDTYFASKELGTNLRQGNTGDCYVVAAIYAMSRSPHFEMIVRSSMKRLPGGSWEVKIPLLSETGEVITIIPEEILPQKNPDFFRRKRGEIIPDLRRKLTTLKGKEGMRVLEAAFVKQRFGFVDRLRAEGGWSDEVLLELGGDNFNQYALCF